MPVFRKRPKYTVKKWRRLITGEWKKSERLNSNISTKIIVFKTTSSCKSRHKQWDSQKYRAWPPSTDHLQNLARQQTINQLNVNELPSMADRFGKSHAQFGLEVGDTTNIGNGNIWIHVYRNADLVFLILKPLVVVLWGILVTFASLPQTRDVTFLKIYMPFWSM